MISRKFILRSLSLLMIPISCSGEKQGNGVTSVIAEPRISGVYHESYNSGYAEGTRDWDFRSDGTLRMNDKYSSKDGNCEDALWEGTYVISDSKLKASCHLSANSPSLRDRQGNRIERSPEVSKPKELIFTLEPNGDLILPGGQRIAKLR